MAKWKALKRRSPTVLPVEWLDAIVEATGTNDPKLADWLLNQLNGTLWLPAELSEEERFRHVRSAIAALRGIKPQDEVEGMVATQMVATHAAGGGQRTSSQFGGERPEGSENDRGRWSDLHR